MNKIELEELLLNRVPRDGLHQWDGVFCIASLVAFLNKKRREKKEMKKKLVILNQEAIKV